MFRRFVPVPLIFAIVLSAGCRIDYLFVAFVIEGFEPYPPKVWTRVFCKRFESSPFELMSGDYDLEFDMDIPDGSPALDGPFPRKLQSELRGYGPADDMVFRYRTRRLRVDPTLGRIEETVTVPKDLIVPLGGEICLEIKPIGAPVIPGWLAGILLEPVVE